MAELDFNSLIRLTAATDKDMSASVSVYNGACSFVVFKKGEGRPILKISAPLAGRIILTDMLDAILANGNEAMEKHKVHKWDPDNKKTDLQGTIAFGRDDKGLVYLGLSGPGFNSTRFPFRLGMLYGADERLTEVKKSELAAKEFRQIFNEKVLLAEALTSFKREFQGGGRPGGGGGGNRGGVSSSDGDMF